MVRLSRSKAADGRHHPSTAGQAVITAVYGYALYQADRLLARDRGFCRDYFKPLKLFVP